ncbi:MAG: HPr family phosphocarrier protein [Lachnospiraceae bacterium]|jgi:phosphocarrier protein|nr:HPr family phosphocarrier protein [Lachnospiraceae bacterium]
MQEFTYTLKDPVGIHARPAGILARKVKDFESTVTIIKGEQSASAGALMKVMALGAKQGDEITIRVEGPDEDVCAKVVEGFFRENM